MAGIGRAFAYGAAGTAGGALVLLGGVFVAGLVARTVARRKIRKFGQRIATKIGETINGHR